MSVIGNLIWILCGGLIMALAWFIVGLLWCVTIVGIPVGVQCFKFAGLSLAPFGKDVQTSQGVGSLLLNLLWLILGGLELAAIDAVIGVVLCCTIVGIPFGMQCFKLTKLALMPFGAIVY